MPEIVGHDKIIHRLFQGVPQVSVFRGEPSVGKWTTALWLKDFLDIKEGDFMPIRYLSADAAREAVDFVRRAPHGRYRMLTVYLGNAPWSNQSMLLTTLESLPTTVFVVFVTSPTDISHPLLGRGEIFDFRRLSTADVTKILMQRNFREETAKRLAELSGGRVGVALRAASSNEDKIAVLGVVRSLRARDAKALDTFASRWSEDCSVMLDALCRETVTGRPMLFSAEDAEATGRKLAMKVLGALRVDVRPRLVIHSQLMTVLKEG